jgi:hypothetical protein
MPSEMTKSDYCRARAEGCERKADAASDPKVKAQLADFADQWRYMAKQAELPGSVGGLPLVQNEERLDGHLVLGIVQ